MKLTGARIEGFLRSPDPKVVAALLYGPDQGLVRERAARLVTAVAGSEADPFRVVEIPADALKDDRARLADETATLSFSGGRRVVRVRDAGDAIVAAVRGLLETRAAEGIAVVEARELGPRSPLRALFETADRAAALPCYLDEGDGLRRLAAEHLAAHGITLGAEAADLLEAHLGADRGLTRRELDKLALYIGDAGTVGAADVRAVVCDAGAVALDTLAFAAGSGDFATLDAALAQAAAEGTSGIAILRAVARHLQRLLRANAIAAGGGSGKQAMDALKPAVFFRLQPEFRRQMHGWTVDHLAEGLDALAEAELRCKTSGAPQALLCHRALFRVAALAAAMRPQA